MYDKTTISAWGVLLNFVTVSGTTLSARLNIYLYVNNTNWNDFGKECAQCPISSGYCYHSFVILYEAIWYIQQRMHAQKTRLLIRTSDSRPTAGVSNLFGPGAKKLVPTAWRASSQTGGGGCKSKKNCWRATKKDLAGQAWPAGKVLAGQKNDLAGQAWPAGHGLPTPGLR